MVKPPSAGRLRSSIHLQRRITLDDGMGNETSGPFETVFTDAAEFIPLRGGEAVMGSRLSGIQPYIVRVRSSIQTRAVGAGWQIVDARSGVVYAISAPPTNQDQKNAWLDIMVTQGRAS